jgi:hypothetical protein
LGRPKKGRTVFPRSYSLPKEQHDWLAQFPNKSKKLTEIVAIAMDNSDYVDFKLDYIANSIEKLQNYYKLLIAKDNRLFEIIDNKQDCVQTPAQREILMARDKVEEDIKTKIDELTKKLEQEKTKRQLS